jgi:hypothetical protein
MSKLKLTIFSLLLSLITVNIGWSLETDFKLLRNLNYIPSHPQQLLQSRASSQLPMTGLKKPCRKVSASFMGVGLYTEGSLAVVTNNGTVELDVESIEVSSQPFNGVLDGNLNYFSESGDDDFFVLTAITADGKSEVEVTVFVSPSTATYSVAYVGSTTGYELSPTVELTDIAGYIKGSLTPTGSGWKFPATIVGTSVIVLGTGCVETEGVFVFQGDLSTEAKTQVILDALEDLEPLISWHTAIWVPDNTVLGGGVSHGLEFVSFASSLGWRWREVLTGAVTGAAVGFIIGGPAGAIAGGVIGGGGAWVVDRVVDPNNEENNYVNSVGVGVVGGVGGGFLGPWVAGGGAAVGGGGATAGGGGAAVGGGTAVTGAGMSSNAIMRAFFTGQTLAQNPTTVAALYWYLDVARNVLIRYQAIGYTGPGVATQTARIQQILQQLQAWGLE